MALATYSDLLAAVATWMDRTDLTTIIPDFVVLTEARIARDLRIRKQVSNTSISTVANTQYIAIPSDFLELENLSIPAASTPNYLSVVTPEWLDMKYPAGINTGQPRVYALLGDRIQFGPTPDAVYAVSIDYYARFAALSVTSPNWLLTNYPNIYLFGALTEGWSYLMDTDKAAYWQARFSGEVKSLNESDDEALRSGSSMRVRYV